MLQKNNKKDRRTDVAKAVLQAIDAVREKEGIAKRTVSINMGWDHGLYGRYMKGAYEITLCRTLKIALYLNAIPAVCKALLEYSRNHKNKGA